MWMLRSLVRGFGEAAPGLARPRAIRDDAGGAQRGATAAKAAARPARRSSAAAQAVSLPPAPSEGWREGERQQAHIEHHRGTASPVVAPSPPSRRRRHRAAVCIIVSSRLGPYRSAGRRVAGSGVSCRACATRAAAAAAVTGVAVGELLPGCLSHSNSTDAAAEVSAALHWTRPAMNGVSVV